MSQFGPGAVAMSGAGGVVSSPPVSAQSCCQSKYWTLEFYDVSGPGQINGQAPLCYRILIVLRMVILTGTFTILTVRRTMRLTAIFLTSLVPLGEA